MQPIVQERELSTLGAASSAKFTISSKGTAHIMRILRDTLYSDKILAVIREYASNAWDAQRAAGKGDQPIKVVFPTNIEPTLVIRDYGKGLSEEDVYNLYIQYGESTKRNTNDEVGFLGIGNKSGFAYTDSFSIVSYHDGIKTIYVANLDPSDEGVISKFHSEPCNDETGMEIQIPVLEKDIPLFKERGQHVLKYFNPPPITNIPITNCSWKDNPYGFVQDRHRDNSYIAVMGCIPYRFEPRQIIQNNMALELRDFLAYRPMVIPLEIGAVDISASREELKYSDLTKTTILNAAKKLLDSIYEKAKAVVANPASTGLEKRTTMEELGLISEHLRTKLQREHLPVSLHNRVIFSSYDNLHGAYGNCLKSHRVTYDLHRFGLGRAIRHYYSTETHEAIGLHRGFVPTFFIKDTKTYKNRIFQNESNSVVVIPRGGHSVETVKKELESHLKQLYLDGVSIKLVSDLPLKQQEVNQSQKHNKQLATLLKYNGQAHGFAPSQNWDEVEHEQSDEDVYVMLNAFKAESDLLTRPFIEAYHYDQELLSHFGIDMPDVFGYRVVKSVKPITPVGISYSDWRKKTYSKIFDDKMKKKVDELRLARRLYDASIRCETLKIALEKCSKKLSKDNDVLQCVEKFCSVKQYVNYSSNDKNLNILKIAAELGYNDEGRKIHEKFLGALKNYPLISSQWHFFSDIDLCLEYIEALDLLRSSRQSVSGSCNN